MRPSSFLNQVRVFSVSSRRYTASHCRLINWRKHRLQNAGRRSPCAITGAAREVCSPLKASVVFASKLRPGQRVARMLRKACAVSRPALARVALQGPDFNHAVDNLQISSVDQTGLLHDVLGDEHPLGVAYRTNGDLHGVLALWSYAEVITAQGFSQPGGQPPSTRRCCRKNSTIACEALGPCGSVNEPAASPPDQACGPDPMDQCSTNGLPSAAR